MVAESHISGEIPRRTDNRRSNKPIMEKRRRARINNCLNELKTLILDAMKKDPARHSKLEKADILEMTVKHLQTVQRQPTDPSVANKFRAGFAECATEVGRFPGIEPSVKRRLLQHLTNCLTGEPNGAPLQRVQLQVPPLREQIHVNGVQLVPTRLPNGDIALVLPTPPAPPAPPPPSAQPSSTPPLLVPIPTRTSFGSSSSASSTTSSTSSSQYSPAGSPEPMDIYNAVQKPLSLVVRKSLIQPKREEIEEEEEDEEEEDKPWRPW